IVPAIAEGRYEDAFWSALTTVATFGAGKVFAAVAEVGWAAWTARSIEGSLEVGAVLTEEGGGLMARFAAKTPTFFKLAKVGVVSTFESTGFTLGGMYVDTLHYGENRFSWKGLGLGVATGIAPFAVVHYVGEGMQMLGKWAESIPVLKAGSEAEAALLKSEG